MLPILACEEIGDGPALVLVHGYLGSDRHWNLQVRGDLQLQGNAAAPVLSDRFRCILPNLAGFGASADLTAPDSIEGHAQMVLETLSQMGVERFHLLGHSMGGMVVQQMAAMAPERIDHLILYGTGPVGVLPNRFEPIEATRKRIVEEGTEANVKRVAATWFKAGEKAPGYAICLKEGIRATPQAMLASLSAWEKWNGTHALSSLAMPTQIIWGDGDRSYGWSQPETLWQTIPNCRLAVVPGCAHAVHMEKPYLFNALVEDFLLPDGTSVAPE